MSSTARRGARLTGLTWAGVAVLMSSMLAAGAAGVASPRLVLTPGSGPPTTTVGAEASGYGQCHADQDDADPAPGTVVFTWAGVEVGTARVADDGTAVSAIRVPDSASSGNHEVTAWCGTDDELVATSPFTVTEAVEATVVVPDVIGMSATRAERRLAQEGLELGRATGDGEVVQDQDPEAGTEAEPGSAVDVDLGMVAPDLVPVPDLSGTSTAAAGVPVRVTVPEPPPSPTPWWAVAAVLAALLGGAVATHRVVTRRAERRWVREHVRTEPRGASPHLVVDQRGPGGSPAARTVRIVPRRDIGIHDLEEVRQR